MKFSIIIISKIYSKGLLNIINDWKKQDYSNKEIIVVSPEINKIKEKGIILIKDPGKNPSIARNLGIKKSEGEYIILKDADEFSDSYIEKDFLSSIFNEIKKIKPDTVYFKFKPFKSKSLIRNIMNIKDTPDYSKDKYSWPIIIKKSIIKDLFDEKLEYGEDLDFISKIKKNSKKPYFMNKDLNNDSAVNNFELFFKRYRWYGNTLIKYLKKKKDLNVIFSIVFSFYFVINIFLCFYYNYLILFNMAYLIYFYFKKSGLISHFIKKKFLLEFFLYPFFDVLSKIIIIYYFLKNLLLKKFN